MKIMKFGGSCLKNVDDFERMSSIVENEDDKKIVVVSGINGVTDLILKTLSREDYNGEIIRELIESLKKIHFTLLQRITENPEIYGETEKILNSRFTVLERLLYGVYYVGELTEKTKDLILSYGERLVVPLVVAKFLSRGLKSLGLEADKIGIVTDGVFGNATANLPETERNVKLALLPLIRKGYIPVITGFFGRDHEGRTTLFGRNGSDYSAAVIAYALDADMVEIWKDVNGFMSADPKIVKDAKLIQQLSYEEAAELAYFGARILHPRAVEPLKLKGIPLRIRDMYHPEKEGTLIHHATSQKFWNIKSVTYESNIGCLKIHGAGVGSKMGVLGEITHHISEHLINIKSVITAQTCITLLLNAEDMDRSYRILTSKNMGTVERIEKLKDISLIGIVGDGILDYPGIAARVFNAVASRGINVEMFAAGASEVAFYFIIKNRHLREAVQVIHNEFFGGDGDS